MLSTNIDVILVNLASSWIPSSKPISLSLIIIVSKLLLVWTEVRSAEYILLSSEKYNVFLSVDRVKHTRLFKVIVVTTGGSVPSCKSLSKSVLVNAKE